MIDSLYGMNQFIIHRGRFNTSSQHPPLIVVVNVMSCEYDDDMTNDDPQCSS